MIVRWISTLFLLAAFFAPFSLSAQGVLRELLRKAHPGEYVVMAQGRNVIVLIVRDHRDNQLTLEEITLPEDKKPRPSVHWNQWIAQGAPGNSAWTAYALDLETGSIVECYSYTKKGWCDIPASENFLGTLLRLPLTPLDPASRRRVGPMPREHEADKRPFWNPPMVLEGKVIPGVSFDAWQTRWPKDEGEMSNKVIHLYLPKEGSPGLSYFPYWLQIAGAVGKVQVRMIDSGFHLESPKPLLPFRPLRLNTTGCFQDGVFRLWLQKRPYHGQVRLFAIDAKHSRAPVLVTFKLLATQDPSTHILEIDPEFLQANLQEGAEYHWRVISTKVPAMSTETDNFVFHNLKVSN